MKKKFALLIISLVCVTANVATAAVAIKKAAPVATKETSASSTATSLVPTVLTLVSNVQELSAQQRAMEQECIPSSAEITFVNDMVKEWAKTGAATSGEISTRLGKSPCEGGTGYEAFVKNTAGSDASIVCYDNFASKADEVMVWYKFPKASVATYCSDGSFTCSDKNKKTVSNIYEIFALIDFDTDDYLKNEKLGIAAKLQEKMLACSDVRINQKKKQMWGEFLTGTMGNVGQKTNTSTIMQMVGDNAQSGMGVVGGISSLGAIASQFMDK